MRRLVPALILATIAVISCKTIQEEDYKNVFSEAGTSVKLARSMDRIDGSETFEIYFMVDKNTKCVKASISAGAYADRFGKKPVVLKTYYIVERLMDIKEFSVKNKNKIYTEIGKNFDPQWDRQRDVVICTSRDDPLKKLDDKSIYRVRFSTFTPDPFSYTLKFNSDGKIFFYKDIQSISELLKSN